jgi:hypothetical protein
MSAQDAPSVPHWTHDYQLVRMDADDWEFVDVLALSRAISYEDGKTRKIINGKNDDAVETHTTGVAAELAGAKALGVDDGAIEAVDVEISDEGDDGKDVTVRRGLDHRRIDCKGHWWTPMGEPSSLPVRVEKVESGKSDVYVLAQVWDSEWVAVHGWATREDLLEDGRRETWDCENYVLDADELRPIEELAEWTEDTGFDS